MYDTISVVSLPAQLIDSSPSACMFSATHAHLCPWDFFSIYNLASHIHVCFVSKYMILLSMKALRPVSHTSVIAAQLNVLDTFEAYF